MVYIKLFYIQIEIPSEEKKFVDTTLENIKKRLDTHHTTPKDLENIVTKIEKHFLQQKY